jgi:hypothetical protein
MPFPSEAVASMNHLRRLGYVEPLQGSKDIVGAGVPRVARNAQPWAKLANAVGVLHHPLTQVVLTRRTQPWAGVNERRWRSGPPANAGGSDKSRATLGWSYRTPLAFRPTR